MANRSGQNPPLEKNGDQYAVRVYRDGKRVRENLGTNYKEALVQRAVILGKLNRNEFAPMTDSEKATITFKDAADNYMLKAPNRKRQPLKPATLKTYQSYLTNHIVPEIGDVPVASVSNSVLKELVAALIVKELGPKTMTEILSVIFVIIRSLEDSEGEPIFAEKTWNLEFIGLPSIGKQKRPSFTEEQVTEIVSRASGHYRALYALLAGTGLRIGEALAIHLNGTEEQSTFNEDFSVLYIRKSVLGSTEQEPKTKASVREVDIHPELASLIKEYVDCRKTGLLFQSETGGYLQQSNLLRDSLHVILLGRPAFQSYRMVGEQKVKHILVEAIPGLPGVKETTGFHAFRRFRQSHLDVSEVPRRISDFWIGHGDANISDRYSRMLEKAKERKTWAFKAGLGFTLPGQCKSKKVVAVAVDSKSKKKKEAT